VIFFSYQSVRNAYPSVNRYETIDENGTGMLNSLGGGVSASRSPEVTIQSCDINPLPRISLLACFRIDYRDVEPMVAKSRQKPTELIRCNGATMFLSNGGN